MPFGQPVQAGLAARPQRQMPQQNRMRQAIGGVNRAQLGAGGPRQGLSPSYARPSPLINTPPAGPSEQGYGRPAMPSPPSAPKLQPTGGVQMGARNQVGLTGPMNNQGATYGGLGRVGLGPSSEMMAQPPQEGRIQGGVRNLPNVQNLAAPAPDLAAYRAAGQATGADMSWMDQPGAISPEYMTPSPLEQQIMASKPEAMANMGAVSNPGLSASPMREVAPRMMNTSVRDQMPQVGLGPSRRLFGRR